MRSTALLLLLLLDTSPRGEEKFDLVLDATKKLKLSFVRIHAGTFLMGETGPHRVRISKPFWLMTTEVTQAQWEFVMGVNPSQFKGDDKPVDSVSWTDAHDFFDRLAPRLRGRKIGLPTEAEWEYACRAASTTTWSFGDDVAKLADYAWYGDSTKEDGSHPAGSKKPNRWGLYDMHGNVLEWVADWHGEYGEEAKDPTGPAVGTMKVVRGGGWYGDAPLTGSARRHSYQPSMRGRVIGFRVLMR